MQVACFRCLIFCFGFVGLLYSGPCVQTCVSSTPALLYARVPEPRFHTRVCQNRVVQNRVLQDRVFQTRVVSPGRVRVFGPTIVRCSAMSRSWGRCASLPSPCVDMRFSSKHVFSMYACPSRRLQTRVSSWVPKRAFPGPRPNTRRVYGSYTRFETRVFSRHASLPDTRLSDTRCSARACLAPNTRFMAPVFLLLHDSRLLRRSLCGFFGVFFVEVVLSLVSPVCSRVAASSPPCSLFNFSRAGSGEYSSWLGEISCDICCL